MKATAGSSAAYAISHGWQAGDALVHPLRERQCTILTIGQQEVFVRSEDRSEYILRAEGDLWRKVEPFIEPTEFGAMVQTDDGPAVRGGHHLSKMDWRVNGKDVWFLWCELRNPRPVKAGVQ